MRCAAPISFAAVVTAVAFAAGGCGDAQRLDAIFPNEVDTVTLYALSGTAVTLPSAYELRVGRPVRSDVSAFFDFAFDLTAAAAPQLLPRGPLGLSEPSGLQVSPDPFDSVVVAPTRGYVYDAPMAADSGVELLAQSRLAVCSPNTGETASYYAKLRVLGVDTVERLIRFEILVNRNCGYRGLEPGLPTR